MAVLTADQFAQQMIAQFRLLDPSGSAEINTPERKVFDTVAAALANNQVDLSGLAGALDIDAKFGTNLDRFTALFGFQRQQAVSAKGFVVFSTNAPAPANINIPVGTPIQSNTLTTSGQSMQYTTTAGATINHLATSSAATPVQCTFTGTNGNAGANTLTILVGSPPPGVTSVLNANAIDGGINQEDDNSYKVRFKNTVFRNLAGTKDQYLALAVSTAYTTKANIIGPISRYQEYMQVPAHDDNGYLNGTQTTYAFTGTSVTTSPTITAITVGGGVPFATALQEQMTVVDAGSNYYTIIGVNSIAGTITLNKNLAANGTGVSFTSSWNTQGTVTEWTTAQSIIPYAAEIYSTPVFIANNLSNYFYRPGVDFRYNFSPSNHGDTWRDNQVLGISPNITFLNVFNPSNGATIAGLQSVKPGDVVLVEYSYRSAASRNGISRGINNAVDVFVNGSNDVQGSCSFLPQFVAAGPWQFTASPNARGYYENFRRDGDKTKRPQLGNYLTPLFNEPVDALPSTIAVNGVNYYLGVHYWLVHEIGDYAGSIRARDGIEWSSGGIGGDADGLHTFPPTGGALAPYQPGGATIIASQSPTPTQIEVDNYNYDSNILVIAGAIENSRQITTDVVVHKNKVRYFKLDITVIYAGANQAIVNTSIATAIQTYFNNQYFGAVIQLSSLLGTIYNVSGVGNARWSNDLPNPPSLMRVIETDALGNPLHGAAIDRLQLGAVASAETQTLYIKGVPSGAADSFVLSWADPAISGGPLTTAPILFSAVATPSSGATTIQTAIRAAATARSIVSGTYYNIAVAADNRPSIGVIDPLVSYTITYGNGTPYLPSVNNSITFSNYTFDSDYFLLDDELPSLPQAALSTDTLPGLIIRPRAESTFYQVA